MALWLVGEILVMLLMVLLTVLLKTRCRCRTGFLPVGGCELRRSPWGSRKTGPLRRMRFVGGPPFVHQDCNLQLSNLAKPVHPEVPRHREALPVRAPPLRSATTAVNGTLRLQLPELRLQLPKLRLHLPKLRLRLQLPKLRLHLACCGLPDEPLHSKRRPATRPAYYTDLDVAMSIRAIGATRLRQQSPKNRRLPQPLPIRCYCSLLSEDQRNKKHTESRYGFEPKSYENKNACVHVC